MNTNQPNRHNIPKSNIKVCAKCKRDITFEARIRQDDGSTLCTNCDANEIDANPITEASTPSVVSTIPSNKTPDKQTVTLKYPSKRPAILVSAAIIFFLAITAGVLYWGLRPTWLDTNRPEIESKLESAHKYYGSKDYKNAYEGYDELLKFVGSNKIESAWMIDRLAEAKKNMGASYEKAKIIIQKEDAEQRRKQQIADAERQAEINRQKAAEAVAQQQRDAEERIRQDRLAQEKEETIRQRKLQELRIKQEAARSAYFQSDDYRKLSSKADKIVSDLKIGLITEDSAYRSISQRAKAMRVLLSIYVQIEAHVSGLNLQNRIDRVVNSADLNLIGEDSAIRAVYKEDRATLDLIELWAETFDSASPNTSAKIKKLISDTDQELATDDSAVRAISHYNHTLSDSLFLIISAKGHGAAATSTMQKLASDNRFEDSAWRAAMHTSKANMDMFVALLSTKKAKQAITIKSNINLNVIGDDSALRIQSEYRQGTVEALHQLILETEH